MAADHEVDMLVECVYIEIAACRIWHGAPRCFRLRVFVCDFSKRLGNGLGRSGRETYWLSRVYRTVRHLARGRGPGTDDAGGMVCERGVSE